MRYLSILLVAVVAGVTACEVPAGRPTAATPSPSLVSGVLNAAFVGLDGVYNSELMAPYDILQHSVFRDSANYIRPFIVSPDGQPFTSFEGITITPHYSFDDAPPVDILVIPSTENSMSADLENPELMAWLSRTVEQARSVISACDGAFPLAATGALNGRRATTFPADRDRFAEMFPSIEVVYDASYVVDGKFITSVGGALSYEPALHLLTHLYGLEHARETAAGLVLDWDPDRGMVPRP
jgi:transcriptional regulator GlxA family with amidase domain